MGVMGPGSAPTPDAIPEPGSVNCMSNQRMGDSLLQGGLDRRLQPLWLPHLLALSSFTPCISSSMITIPTWRSCIGIFIREQTIFNCKYRIGSYGIVHTTATATKGSVIGIYSPGLVKPSALIQLRNKYKFPFL